MYKFGGLEQTCCFCNQSNMNFEKNIFIFRAMKFSKQIAFTIHVNDADIN